jgi:uncharacterized protein (DUF924 family)
MSGNETPHSILAFWFGDKDDDVACAAAQATLWWSKNADTDTAIGVRFAGLIDAASEGELDDWRQGAESALARIILVDQFRRNVYRGTAEAFSADAQAQRWCLEGLARGQDQELRPIQRLFCYLPLEHAEDLALQEHCVALFEKLLADVPDAHRETFGGFLDFARRHRDVIKRFGRFPHRNECLERECTPKELAFLEQPGSSF